MSLEFLVISELKVRTLIIIDRAYTPTLSLIRQNVTLQALFFCLESFLIEEPSRYIEAFYILVQLDLDKELAGNLDNKGDTKSEKALIEKSPRLGKKQRVVSVVEKNNIRKRIQTQEGGTDNLQYIDYTNSYPKGLRIREL